MQPSVTNQQGQGNQGLASLFRSNTGPQMGAPAQLPQITAPQRPNIAMPAQAPQMPQGAGQGTAFGAMSPVQRMGLMMGGRMNPSTGKMDLPTDMDRGSVIAARNMAKGSMMNGGENPFTRIFNPHRGGSR